MSGKINIRRAMPGDAPIIAALSEITFVESFKGTCSDEDLDHFVNKCFSPEGIEKELKDENDFYFIAWLNDDPAGYIRLKEDYTDYPAMKKYRAIELKRIYVLLEYQNKKIGAALMARALELAVGEKFEAVWLGVWEFNDKAIEFYKKREFTDTGFTHTFYIGSTAQTDHWMIRMLPQ
ncbi:MAG: GNAT family N-acetyltransferase [Ginsengibacter sp.]